MGTLSLLALRTMIRDDLNVASTTLTDAELNSAINDGYKDVAVMGLCYESKISYTSVTGRIHLLTNVIRVNFVEYSAKGLPAVTPQSVGQAVTPMGWFQWGKWLVIERPPDTAFSVDVFAACYPAAVMSADADTPASLPDEFHPCVYQFGKAVAAFKLRRWTDAAGMYNQYIADVLKKRAEFIMKFPDGRLMREEPDNVEGASNG